MKKTPSQKGKKQRKQDSSAEEDDDEDEDDEDDEDTPKRQTRRRGATKVKRCHISTFINMVICLSRCLKL